MNDRPPSAEASRNERFRVALVGMDLSPLSVAVFEALTLADDLEVLPFVARRPGALGRAWRDYGWRVVVRGCLHTGAARRRMLMRRIGLRRTRGFGSLPEAAAARNVALRPVRSLNSAATVEQMAAEKPDLLLVAACDQILKRRVLEVPRLGCVNVHPSLLPAYRGPTPWYWVLANGESRTGVTFHQIDEGVDTGPILAQREVAIPRGESEPKLRRRCARLAGEMAVEVVRGVRDGTLVPRPQPEEGASYFGKPPWGRSRI